MHIYNSNHCQSNFRMTLNLDNFMMRKPIFFSAKINICRINQFNHPNVYITFVFKKIALIVVKLHITVPLGRERKSVFTLFACVTVCVNISVTKSLLFYEVASIK